MKDQSKTKQVLINELVSLRKRNAELEQSESERKRAEEALRESEARYRALVENANDIVFRTDDAGYVTFGNRAGFRITGYEEEEIIGKHYSILVRPDMRDEAVKFFGRQFVKGLQNTYSEYPILTKEGHEVWLGQNTQLLLKDGRVIGFQAVARDITERRKAEAVLKRSEEFFRAISENASDIILIADKKGTITYASPSVEHILGYKLEELIGKRSLDLIVPDDLARAIQDFGKAIFTKGVLVPNAFRVRHKDGSERVLEGVGKNLFENPSVAGFVMNVRDITEQKKTEEALRAAEELYRTLAESSQVSVYIVQDRKIVFANSHFSNYSGYEKENILGRDVSSFVYPEDRERVRRKAIQLLKGESAIPYEYRIIDKSGRIRWLMETVSKITYQDRPATLGNTMDITELKRMEKELEDIRRTLIQSEKLAALGQLASGAAHEIRNPLNIMSLRMQVLEITGKALDEDVRKAIDTCNTQIKRIIRVLDGLYEFSRIPQTRKAPNDLNKIMEEVIASQDKRFKDEEIIPEIHRGENIPSVMLDKEKITMVITHLISNAVDAMRGQDTRHFRISTEKIPAEDKVGESVRLIVFDTGHGISEMDRARVFDPFFTTKDPDKGKGLGLAISYGIIREHGGTIRVENNHEGGVSVLIDFPVRGSATA